MNLKVIITGLTLSLLMGAGLAVAADSKYASWSDKTICRLVADISTSSREDVAKEAVSRGLSCIPVEFSHLSESANLATLGSSGELLEAKKNQAENTTVSASIKGETEKVIADRAKNKKFMLFNNPGKEIVKLLSKEKFLEAYYIYKYNLRFFDKTELLGKKKNSVKYVDSIRAIANYYYKSVLENMSEVTGTAYKLKNVQDQPSRWLMIRKLSRKVNSIEKELKALAGNKRLLKATDEYWEFKKNTQWIDARYGGSDSRIINYFKAYAFTIDAQIFDVYPVELDAITISRVSRKAIKELHSADMITTSVLKKYKNMYDFQAYLGSSVLNKIRLQEVAESSLDDQSTNIFTLMELATKTNDPDFLKKVFVDRRVHIQHPNPSEKFPLKIECFSRSCIKKANAQIQIIITLKDKGSNILQVGTLNKTVRVKSGTNVVPNPTYNRLVNQLNSLSRKIQAKARQQQINQQANSNNTYQSDCTAFGSNINCTTTQQPNDYAIGAQSGALMAQGLNAMFGLKTEEDQYREVENKLLRTSPSIQEASYANVNVAIPEYEVTRSASATIHIFDSKNKEYKSLPISLIASEKWLVPNNSNVFSLPLNQDIKKRLLASNLVNSKASQYLTLDLIQEITSSGGSLKLQEYIEPSEFVLRAEQKQAAEVNIVAVQSASATQAPVKQNSPDSDYYELLGNDEFINWAKTDPILKRLLQGFVEGNEKAIEVLTKKWIERN